MEQDTNEPNSHADRANFLSGGGEMGARMRAFDWSRTPLGEPETWQQSLKTAVRLMLNSRFSMFIWWGAELIYLYNDAYMPTLGIHHPQALGRPAPQVWSEIWQDLEPQAKAVIERGEAAWNEELLLFLERRGFPEETYHTFSYSPITDDVGRIGGLFCAVSEETAKVLSRRRLQTLRELGERTLAEAKTVEDACRAACEVLSENPFDVPFALIYLLDEEGKRARLAEAIRVDPRLHKAAAPDEIEIKTTTDVWDFGSVLNEERGRKQTNVEERVGRIAAGAWTDDFVREAFVAPLAKSGAHDLPAGFIVCGVSPRLVFSADYKGFLELAAGHIATAISNARALEEERKRAEALTELDRAKTAFFSNVSHESRTPRTLMLSPVEEILAKPEDDAPPDNRELLEVVRRNGQRLLKPINALLDFSRIEAGRVQAVYEPTDLSRLTAELASVFRSAIERAGMRLVVDCEPLPEPVYVDRDMWEKIVLNLLSNAYKFTFEGEIKVALKRNGNGVELLVKDTGIGIPEDELPNIFNCFHRIENARGRTHEGTGIGLALVQELVKLHGGEIAAESVYGAGMTFKVTLPFGKAHLPTERVGGARTQISTALNADAFVQEAVRWGDSIGDFGIQIAELKDEAEAGNDPPRDASDQSAIRNPLSAIKRPFVVLADNNADMRDYIRRLLSQHYEVEAVADGQAALEAVRRRPPDLVLTDVMMPRLDGFGLLKALRADERTRHVPVVMLSARAGEESKVEGLEAGADDYLIKPFSGRELLARVGANIALANMRREVEAERERSFTILESVGDAFYALDHEFRFAYVNQRAEKYFGVRREDLIGRNIWEAFPSAAATIFQESYERALRERAAVEFETLSNFSNRWVEVRAYPTADWLLVNFRDITERKQAEERLRASEARLAAEANALGRLNDASSQLWRMPGLQAGLDEMLAATIALLGADMGNIQLLDIEHGVLRIAAQRGFKEDFLNFFREVSTKDDSACGRTLRSGERTVIEDVESDAPYAPLRPVARAAGYRAVQSTPLIGRNGAPLGMLSTHWRSPHRPSEQDLRRLDLYVRQAADFIERCASDEALRQSEERLQLATEAAEMFSWEIDYHLRKIKWSENASKIIGCSPDKVTDDIENSVFFVLPEDRARLLEEFQSLLAQGKKYYSLEFRGYEPEGERKFWEVQGSIIYDANGAPARAFGITQNITKRKRAEQAVREGQERLAMALNVASMFSWKADLQTGAITYSDSIKTILGYEDLPAEYHDLKTVALRVHAQDRERVGRIIERAVNETGELFAQYRLQSNDRGYVWFEAHGVVIRDGAGVPVQMVGVAHDINERKLAEEQIAGQNRALEALAVGKELKEILDLTTQTIESILPDSRASVLLADEEEKRLRCDLAKNLPAEYNAAIEGIRIGEGVGSCGTAAFRRTPVIVSDIARDPLWENFRELAAAHNLAACWSHPILAPDGKLLGTFAVYFSELRTPSRQEHLSLESAARIAGIAIYRKRTEAEREELLRREKELRAQAEEASRLKDEFLATVSHELRTPLTSILGWSSMIRTRQLDEKTLKLTLETIERNARVQNRLVEDLLEVSRIITGKIRLDMQPIDLTAVVRSACATARPAAEAKAVALRASLNGDDAQVCGDPARLQQSVWNLLSNAVKFTGRGGSVEVSLQRVEGEAEIRVSDTGEGIAPEFLPYVFDRFRQADGASTRRHGGLGLGLSIVRHLIEMHGGMVTATSEGEGKGATFTIRLPLMNGACEGMSALDEIEPYRDENQMDLNSQTAGNGSHAALKGVSVLVVDDEDDTRSLMRMLLERHGARVETAESVAEALSALSHERFDVILSDIGMPVADGYELIRRIRELPASLGGQTPAGALTAYARAEDRERALAAGFQLHIAKPADPVALIESVARLARSSAASSPAET